MRPRTEFTSSKVRDGGRFLRLSILREQRMLYPEALAPLPARRAECVGAARPCPHVRCRHHLHLDVTPSGSIVYNQTGEVWEQAESCSLDLAERGGMTLAEVAETLGVCRERIRQIEVLALAKCREAVEAEEAIP